MKLEQAINRAGTALVGAYMSLSLRLDVEQHASLPNGAKLIAANHPSTTDPFYILPLVREPMVLLIIELAFRSPVFGRYLKAAGHIRVTEGNERAAFDEAVRRLRAGQTVGIFPEGVLSPEHGGPGRFHTGAVRLALEAGVPIVPVGIHLDRERIHQAYTTYGDQSDTACWYLDGPYAMTFGEAMHFDGSPEDWDYVREASELLATRVDHLARESAYRLAAPRRAIPILPVLLSRLARILVP